MPPSRASRTPRRRSNWRGTASASRSCDPALAGVVTARSVEPGEVVQPGQVIVQLARDDGRDAVFNVPARFLEQQDEDPVDPRCPRR